MIRRSALFTLFAGVLAGCAVDEPISPSMELNEAYDIARFFESASERLDEEERNFIGQLFHARIYEARNLSFDQPFASLEAVTELCWLMSNSESLPLPIGTPLEHVVAMMQEIEQNIDITQSMRESSHCYAYYRSLDAEAAEN